MQIADEYWFDLGPLSGIPRRGARTVKVPRREIAVSARRTTRCLP